MTKSIKIFFGICLFILQTSLAQIIEPTNEIRILESKAIMRELASPSSNTLYELPIGTQVKILGLTGGYYKVEYNGKIGYINEIFIKKTEINIIKSVPTNSSSPLTPEPKLVLNNEKIGSKQSKNKRPKKETREELLNSWIGRSKNELLKKWGMASRTSDDGKGGQILAYEGRRTTGGFIFGNYIENTYTDFTEIFVDSNNIIYYWHIGRR